MIALLYHYATHTTNRFTNKRAAKWQMSMLIRVRLHILKDKHAIYTLNVSLLSVSTMEKDLGITVDF